MPYDQELNVHWLTDQDLLIIHTQLHWTAMNSPSAETRNMQTGASKNIPQFQSTTRPKVMFIGSPPKLNFTLTPDRHTVVFEWFGRLMCISLDEKKRNTNPTWHNFLDDAPSQRSLHHPFRYSGGPSNSSEWIYCFDDMERTQISYVIGNQEGMLSKKYGFDVPSATSDNVDTCSQVGMTPEGHVLECVTPVLTTLPIRTLLECIPGQPKPVRVSSLTLPIPKALQEESPEFAVPPKLSPDGTKIAWLLPYAPARPDSKPMAFLRQHHILPALPDHAIWVSDRYGRNMRRVSTWTSDDAALSDLDWTPSGRYITFQQHALAGAKQQTDALLCKIPVQ